MHDIHFGCTVCGKCCHDLKLPLTVEEAVTWLGRGNEVQVICEGLPWPVEPPADNLPAAHRRNRSFPATSGSLAMRIVVILAADFVGGCPNLMPDQRCGIYEKRPLVCRIYPAEVNPFIKLSPANKVCPPDAWTPNRPLLLRNGRIVNDTVRAQIEAARATDIRDVECKRRLCAALHMNSAAVINEGFVAYSPRPAKLLAALVHAALPVSRDAATPHWRFVSERPATVAALTSVGADVILYPGVGREKFEFLGLPPA